MPVAIKAEAEARPRIKVRGSISSNTDYGDVIRNLQAVVNQGKSLEVQLDLDNGFPLVKGERKKIPFLFCASLRRFFANNGIPCECYQSAPNTITVKKAARPPKKPVQKRK
jgi:hypothetical protein